MKLWNRAQEKVKEKTPCEKYGVCVACRQCRPPHYLYYGDSGDARFPYCIECHKSLSIADKKAVVDRLIASDHDFTIESFLLMMSIRSEIHTNIEAGL